MESLDWTSVIVSFCLQLEHKINHQTKPKVFDNHSYAFSLKQNNKSDQYTESNQYPRKASQVSSHNTDVPSLTDNQVSSSALIVHEDKKCSELTESDKSNKENTTQQFAYDRKPNKYVNKKRKRSASKIFKTPLERQVSIVFRSSF